MNAYKILVGKPKGTRRLECNGMTALKWDKTGCEGVDYAQDKGHAEECSRFYSSRVTIRSSRRVLLRE
jgi:hypothetical protein